MRSLVRRISLGLLTLFVVGSAIGYAALGEITTSRPVLWGMYCTHLVVALLTFGLLAFQATHISPTWSTWWKVRYFAFLIGFIVVSNVGFIRVAHLLGAEFSADYAFNAGNVVDRLYLCIMTLARLGLGEIVPANPPARAVVLVELAFVPSLILSASVVEMRKWFGNGE